MKLFRASAWILAVVAGLLPTTIFAQTDLTLTRGNIQTASVADLVRFAWPGGNGPTIVERQVTTEGVMLPPLSPPQIRLFQAPTLVGQRLCQRIGYVVPLQWRDRDLYYSQMNKGERPSIDDNAQLSLGAEPRQSVGLSISPNCQAIAGQRFAAFETSSTDEAIVALNLLDHVHQNARSRDPLSFSVRCATRNGPNRCSATPKESLAQLPVNLVWNIKQGEVKNSYEFWINEPNQLLWEVTIVSGNDKTVVSVTMTSLIPHPF